MISIDQVLSSLSLNDKRIISSNNATNTAACQQLNQSQYQQKAKSVSELSIASIHITNFMIYLARAYNRVCPSQETIAKVANITRKQANIIMRKLHELGLVIKIYRHRRTCQYKLSKIFYEPEFKALVAGFLIALNPFGRAPELARRTSVVEKVTPLIYKLSIYIKENNYLKQNNCMKRDKLYHGTVTESHTLQEEAMKLQSSRTVRSMQDFTEGERNQLCHYDDSVLKVAMAKTFGRPLFNPFGYFRNVCEMTKPAAEQSAIAIEQPVKQEDIYKKEDHKEGTIQTSNKPQPSQSAYMERPVTQTDREKDWSRFVWLFMQEGNKIRKMLNEEKLLYCYQQLIPRGTTKEDIDRRFHGLEMFDVISEAKNSAANDAVLEYNKRNPEWQWLVSI